MNWLDQLCCFYTKVTGNADEERLAKVRREGEFTFADGREYTVTWDPLDREVRPKRAYKYAYLRQNGLYAEPLSVAIPGEAIYTQIRCKLPHYRDRSLELGGKKCLIGNGWKWQVKTDLPERTVEQLKALLLSVEPERPDLYHIHLSSAKSYDRLVVETPVLRGIGSNFRIFTEYELRDEAGKLLPVDEASQVIFRKLLTLAQRGADLLDP